MKNKLSGTVTSFGIIFFASAILVSCQPIPAEEKQYTKSAKRIDIGWIDEYGNHCNEEISVVIVDSCEYLLSKYDRSRTITHKGNCSFCKIRRNGN